VSFAHAGSSGGEIAVRDWRGICPLKKAAELSD